MPTRQYVFKVDSVEKISDGDSYWLRCDVGLRHWALVHVRLLGWDTPEKNAPREYERKEAKVATLMAAAFLTEPDGQLWVRTEKDPDMYGRWLGDIWRERLTGTVHLGEALYDEGLATRWPTRWREEHPDPGGTA